VNALQRVHGSLVPGAILLDLQPTLANALVRNPNRFLGRLDEREFRAFTDRVNSVLEETIEAGLFAHESQVEFIVAHRFDHAPALLAELKTWTGTTVPSRLLRRLERSAPPFEVHEGARLRRLRTL
jgi:hypothetical protein